MKFCYVDESGDKPQSDVFVMTGVLVDAYKLRKHTARFDQIIADFLAKHPGAPTELKTKAAINGEGGWRQVNPAERKQFISKICDLAAECATIFPIALSFQAFEKAAKEQRFTVTYWIAAAMFVAAFVQRKMQPIKKNKGLAVLIFDDNRREVPNFSDALYRADPWYDPIYQTRKKRESAWKEISEGTRFNQIVNSAFAIKSTQHARTAGDRFRAECKCPDHPPAPTATHATQCRGRLERAKRGCVQQRTTSRSALA
jgi:Protein of unknown function (DUF3800)